MPSSHLRKLAVVFGVAAAILIPILQAALDLGLSQAEFAAQGNSTLRAAGYAFSIWSLIYLGLVVFAVHHWRARESLALIEIGWPAAFAAAGCGLWIVAASANAMWATVVIILASLAAALTALVRAAPLAQGRDRRFAVVPVGLLAGWLTIAAALNLVTALTATGLVSPSGAFAVALIAVGLAVLLALAVLFVSRVWAYPLPTAWGLAAVVVAEHAQKPTLAWIAAAAAVLLLLAAMAVATANRSGSTLLRASARL